MKMVFVRIARIVQNFWSGVIKWLADHKVKIENLSDKDILFGIYWM